MKRDDTLLDESCAYISNIFFFIAEYDENEEALTISSFWSAFSQRTSHRPETDLV